MPRLKKGLKKSLLALVILPVILVYTSQVFALHTIRTAILPPLGLARQTEKEALSLIEQKLAGRFKFPFYEKVPVTAANQQSIAIPVNKKDAALKEALAKYAAALKAEIIILPYVEQLDGRIISSFDSDDTCEEFAVRLVCYIYSVQADELLSIRAVRQGTAPVGIYSGMLPALADALEEILASIPFAPIPSRQSFTLFK